METATPAVRPALSKCRTRFAMVAAGVVMLIVVAILSRPSALRQCDRLRALANDAHEHPPERCREYLEQRRLIRSVFRYRDVALADLELIPADDVVLELMLRPYYYKDVIVDWCRSYSAFLGEKVEAGVMQRLTRDFGTRLKKERYRTDWVEKLVRDHLGFVIEYTARVLRQNLSEKHSKRIRIAKVGGDFKILA